MKNKKLIEEIKARLRERRSSLLREVAENEQQVNDVIEQRESEQEENAQIDRITQLMAKLNSRDQRILQEINGALERIAAGQYGMCSDCGTEIGASRLRAIPTATLCIDCATTSERRNRQQRGQPASLQEDSVQIPVNRREMPSWFESEEPEN